MSIDATRPGGVASRMALTRHELPDGSWHFDWFIERPDVAIEHRLRTFRVMRDPAAVEQGHAFEAEPIADHRAVYLDYSGPVSGSRGSVSLRWSQRCRVLRLDAQQVVVAVEVGGRPIVLSGRPAEGDTWRFVRTAAAGAGG